MTRRLAVPVTLLITFLSLFLSSFNFAFANEIVEVKYAAATKASGSGTCPAKFPATAAYSQGFRHLLTANCYSCPAGFTRSITNINAGDACIKRTPASSAFSKAKYHGKKNVPKPAPMYGGNVFSDPRNGGEWWECHRDYPRRTLHPVTHKAACATKSLWPNEKLARAKFRSKKTRSAPAGTFYDPRGDGEYWSCPQGYNRTILWGVHTGKACEKVTQASTRTAPSIRRGVRGCPSGAFEHGISGACYSCPTGYKRSLVIASDLTKEPKACVKVTVDPKGIENQQFVAFAKDELKKMEAVIEPTVKMVGTQVSRMPDTVSSLLNAKSDAERQRIAAQIAAPIIRQLNPKGTAVRPSSNPPGTARGTTAGSAFSLLPLKNGWVTYGGPFGQPSYTKTNNIVTVSGLVNAGKHGLIATLPVGYRPDKQLVFNLNNHERSARIDVKTNGDIVWVAGGKSHGWLSLSGIQFSLNRGETLRLTNGWQPYGGPFGKPTASDSNGIVTLSGLVKSGKHGLIATLPKRLWPNKRLVFSLNNHQNPTRIDVTPEGDVVWMAGGTSHGWLSLSGIQFPRNQEQALPLTNGWGFYGASYGKPSYKKSNGLVTVSGLIKSGKHGLLAKLPEGYRPEKTLVFNLNNHEHSARIDVRTNGDIVWIAGGKSHGWLSLSGINFPVVEQPVDPYVAYDTPHEVAADAKPDDDANKPVNLRGDRIESSVPGVPLDQTVTVGIVVDASLGLGGTFTPFLEAFPTRGKVSSSESEQYIAFAGTLGLSAGADGSIEIGIWMDPYEKLAGGSMGVVGGVAYKAGYAMTFWWSTAEEPKFLGFTMTPQVGISAELEFTAGGTWKR